ncbi:hypothetical protein ABIA33_006075 [Streptacidiphilus sp. MAP12-16]|uniref:LAETG motif-containing sortase-dependent surface protein n=1 Tax=Streptacidiphilus sp. MAP12-16 TaxID=3156300 RepID=UPI0035156D9D
MSSRPSSSRGRIIAVSGTSLLAAGVVTGALGLSTSAFAATSAPAKPVSVPAGFTVHQLATGPTGQTSPDDITRLGDHLFVAYQNGVGSDGKPSPAGATKSTIVEYTLGGQLLASWPVVGKVDGMGADQDGNRVLASVNEDGNSSLYSVTPGADAAKQLQHFTYQGLTHGGGTDSVLAVGGKIYITASAPAADADGKTYSKTALYTAELVAGAAGKDGTVTLTAVIADNATATDAVTAKSTKLNLSDPDSSEQVPSAVAGFGGDLLLDSQGDKQLVFLHGKSTPKVLNLTTQVDDTAFATNSTGTLYVVDSKSNKLLAITGPFTSGEAFTSVPSDSTTLPGTLGRIDLSTGTVSAFASLGSPKGLLYVDDALPVTSTPSASASPAPGSSGSTAASPTASSTAPVLATTGGGSNTGVLAGVAAAVVALGAGAVTFARRRAGRRS